jgi:hypothetical protein
METDSLVLPVLQEQNPGLEELTDRAVSRGLH